MLEIPEKSRNYVLKNAKDTMNIFVFGLLCTFTMLEYMNVQTSYRRTNYKRRMGDTIMGLWLQKMEQKYGRFAIRNITLYLIVCYFFGYVIGQANSPFFSYLTLNPYEILHGQIWRLVTWIIIPPDSLDVFTLLMLYFYFSIGTTLERTWGTFTYNFYLFLGMMLTIIGAFLMFLIVAVGVGSGGLAEAMAMCSVSFSTYYICMSIILAFAMTFPDVRVLVMWVFPVKIKILGIIYAVILGFQVFSDLISILSGYYAGTVYQYYFISDVIAIVFSLLNFIIFFVGTRKSFRTPKQIKRQREFKKKVVPVSKISKHKCAICGRSSEEYPDLDFRFCSKCDGNYEYCSEHLYTHQHIKQS